MKKVSIIIVALLSSVGLINAQTAEDALRNSQYGLFGTAAYVGRAGAIGALGGDLTASSYNPAGLGTYYKSEFIFSPSIHIGSSKSTYFGTKSSDFRASFSLAPVGLLFAIPMQQEGWKFIQVGIGANRLASFNNETSIDGDNPYSSLTDLWVADANNYGLDDYTSGLAWETYLIDFDTINGRYFSLDQGPSRQNKYYKEKGGIDEITLSVSGNYEDFLYLGATLGIPIISYEYSSSYTEYHDYGNSPSLTESFNFGEQLYTDGVGVNLKVGAILRPINWLRIGLAFHTPSFYSLQDSYQTYLTDFIGNSYVESRYSEYNYYLITPFKAIASLGATLGNQNSIVAGSLGIDYEYSDYSLMSYQMDDNWWERTQNDLIENAFRAGHVVRAGGTLNIKKAVIRAGYAFFGNPYESSYVNSNKNAITFGLGYKSRSWYIDVAYAFTSQKGDYNMYDPTYSVEPVTITKKENLFMTTFGFRF